MTHKPIKRRIDILTAFIAGMILLLCAFVLCACNSDGSDVKETERQYDLYFAGIIYSQDDGVMYAIATLNGDEENKLQAKLDWYSRTYTLSVWYNRQDVNMTVNPSELYAELDGIISEEQHEHDGVEYNRLKVVLRYDTIYKSINSDASVVKSGRYYQHSFQLDEENESEVCSVWLKSQNTANWYAILIACGIVFAAVITAVMLSIKGGVWQKKKKKNE